MPSSTITRTIPKIDTHAHFLPPFYQQACRAHGHEFPDGMPGLPDWSPEAHLAMMDRLHIRKSILSISSPGTHLVASDAALARDLCRRCNAYAAEVKRQWPARFGYFASLPLPDVAGAVAEIGRAVAEGCDGFVLLTNAHGHYLGDAALDPVLAELDRRRALVFIHPTTPRCVGGAAAAPAPPRLPHPVCEFFFDTARVVANLFLSGAMARHARLRVILPHLGGAFPPLLSRWTGFSAVVPGVAAAPGVSEDEVAAVLRERFWFDMAGFAFPSQIRGLMAGVGVAPGRLLYGSDFPFTGAAGVEMLLGRMDEGVAELFDPREIEDVYHGNAERLLAM